MSIEPVPQNRGRLQRALGLAFGVAVAVGSTIGVGILRTPGIVADHMGGIAAALAIWIAGAAYVLLSVNYTAELATAIPRSGGPYAFADRTLGKFGGILVGWSDFLNSVYSIAILAVALGEYSAELFGAEHRSTAISLGLIAAFTAVNMVGVRAASGAQQMTSIIKVLVLWSFILMCFVYGAPSTSPTAAAAPSLGTASTIVGSLLAFQLILGVYTGWRAPAYFAEESRGAADVPRALFLGAVFVAATYIGVNLAIFHVLPYAALVESKLPAADAAGIVGAQWGLAAAGVTAVTVIAVLSLPSTMQGVFMQTSRALYAMGQDGLFIRAAASVNRRGAPAVAALICGIVSLGLASTSTFEELFTAFALFGVLNNFLLVYGALRLRRLEPDLPRPYRAWGFPWAFYVLLVIDGGVFFGFLFTNLKLSLITLAALAAIYPLYRWNVAKRVPEAAVN